MLGKLNLVKSARPMSSLGGKVVFFAVATTIGIANIVGGAGAALNATAFNTANQNINSGKLSLTLSAGSASAGFGTAITGMKPLDTQTRFVDYTNDGDLAFLTPTLSITAYTSSGSGGTIITAGSADAILTTGAAAVTSGIRVWVQNCAAAWTFTAGSSSSAASCASPTDVISTGSGTATVLNRAVPIATGGSGTAMTNLINTPAYVNHLMYTLYIPDKSETTVNGKTNALYATPALDPASIQGKNAWVTWQVQVQQPALTTGNS
jgi:hypothetical protein